jgi:hypothetical protein
MIFITTWPTVNRELEENGVQEQQLGPRGQEASLQCLAPLEPRQRKGQVAVVVVVAAAAAIVVGVAQTCAELQSLPSSDAADRRRLVFAKLFGGTI